MSITFPNSQIMAGIKMHFLFINYFEFITNPEIRFEHSRGSCCYPSCPNRALPSNERYSIVRNGQRRDTYNFHSSCIERMLNDESIPSLN